VDLADVLVVLGEVVADGVGAALLGADLPLFEFRGGACERLRESALRARSLPRCDRAVGVRGGAQGREVVRDVLVGLLLCLAGLPVDPCDFGAGAAFAAALIPSAAPDSAAMP
jgi:hypothetical protein